MDIHENYFFPFGESTNFLSDYYKTYTICFKISKFDFDIIYIFKKDSLMRKIYITYMNIYIYKIVYELNIYIYMDIRNSYSIKI